MPLILSKGKMSATEYFTDSAFRRNFPHLTDFVARSYTSSQGNIYLSVQGEQRSDSTVVDPSPNKLKAERLEQGEQRSGSTIVDASNEPKVERMEMVEQRSDCTIMDVVSYEPRLGRLEKRKRSRNWELHEIILLLQAKKIEREKLECSSFREKFESASDKWKAVVTYLSAHGVEDRDVNQCRSKWENLYSDFKEIKEWNWTNGNPPYASLTREMKKQNNLPGHMDPTVFEMLDAISGKKLNMVAIPEMDSSSMRQASEQDDSQERDFGDIEAGSSGKRKHSNSSAGLLVAMGETSAPLQCSIQDVDVGKFDQQEQIMSDKEKIDPEKRRLEFERVKLPADREVGDIEVGFGNKRKPNAGSSNWLAAMGEMNTPLQCPLQDVELAKVSQQEQMLELEREKIELKKRKLEIERQKLAAEREDRKKIIGILASLAKTFERLSEKI